MATTNEMAMLGCIFADNSIMYDIYSKVNPEMLTDPDCKSCYESMLALYDTGKDINPAEVSQMLNSESFTIDNAVKFISECIQSIALSSEYRGHTEIIVNEYKVRMVGKYVNEMSLLPKDIDNSIATLITRLEEIEQGREKSSKTLKEVVEEFKDQYFKDIEEKKIYTGFDKIDECLGGLDGGELIVIGARPGVGKSALVTQIITHMASEGLRVGYFNLEMSYKQVFERILARFSQLGLSRIKRAKAFLNDEKPKFNKAIEKMLLDNLIITSGSRKVSDIKAESRHQKYDVIVIDYLQLIRADRLFNNRASEVGEISKSLKALAMEMNIPIVALSQMNRENDETQEPNISDLRESGDIEQDASVIALMWNLDDKGCKGFKVGKNRQGELLKIGLQFDGDTMTFKELGKIDSKDKNTKLSDMTDMPWG